MDIDYNINMILACDIAYNIGKDNDILYHFPKDLKHFKEVTSSKTVVMGRKTWESLPFKLPNRKNIVITNQKELKGDKQPDLIADVDTVLELSKNEEIWVIGGSQIYNFFVFYAKTIELTRILAEREADTDVLFLADHLLNYDIVDIKIDHDIDKKTNQEHQINFIRYEYKSK